MRPQTRRMNSGVGSRIVVEIGGGAVSAVVSICVSPRGTGSRVTCCPSSVMTTLDVLGSDCQRDEVVLGSNRRRGSERERCPRTCCASQRRLEHGGLSGGCQRCCRLR